MDNQHKMISGYRDLDEGEIDRINELKQKEADLRQTLREMEREAQRIGDSSASRWIAIARTHLETGMMYAIKAVARPDNGLGRPD